MFINRRHWLGLSAAAGVLPAFAAAAPLSRRIQAPGASPGFAAAVGRIADHAVADLADNGFPGMALAIRAASGETALPPPSATPAAASR